MLNYSWIPVALDVASTCTPSELFIITVITVSTERLRNNGTLKRLVQFIIKKASFYFVHKYREGAWWLMQEAGFLFYPSGARKPKGAYPVLSQTLTWAPRQGWFSWGKSPENQWRNTWIEGSETLIGIHKLWFRFGNDLPVNCLFIYLFLASHETRHD